MRRTIALLVCGLTVATAGSVRAAEDAAKAPAKTPVFNIMGPSECSRWPRRGSIDSAAKAVPLNWALGFLSGEAERSDPRLFDLLQPEKVSAWLDNYCQAHPTDTLPAAMRVLTAELEAQLPPLPPPPPPMFVPPQTAAAKPPAKSAPAKATAKKPAPKKPAPRKPATTAPARQPTRG